MRGHNDAHRPIHAREFFDRGDVLDVAHSRAAVFGGEDRPQQAQLAQFFDCRQRKLARLVPLHDMRKDFALSKLAYALLHVQLLFI